LKTWLRLTSGGAHAVRFARAIDTTEQPRVVATLAGDDTCLVVTRDEKDARAVAAHLNEAIG
jgi:arginine repressor